MRIKLWHILIITVVMATLHFLALAMGWYIGRPNIDIILHIIGGIFLASVALWAIGEPLFKRYIGSPTRLFSSLQVLGFTLFGAFTWEIFEYFTTFFLPLQARVLAIDSTNLRDALSDMAYGIFGALIVIVATYILEKSRNKLDNYSST